MQGNMFEKLVKRALMLAQRGARFEADVDQLLLKLNAYIKSKKPG